MHTTNSKHEFPIAENILLRNFEADAPNKKWIGAITYIPTHEGWVYLALLVDLFSRKIVGWAVSDTMYSDLPQRALGMALLRRRPEEGLSITQTEVFNTRVKAIGALLRSTALSAV